MPGGGIVEVRRPDGLTASWSLTGSNASASGRCDDWGSLVGSRGARSRSIIAGLRDATSALPRSLPSSSSSRWMSIVTVGSGALAPKQVTSAIPIVFAAATDPLGGGLVASLARPGGNATGLSMQASDAVGKRLELLRELLPDLRRLAIIGNVDYAAAVHEMAEVRAAARRGRGGWPCRSRESSYARRSGGTGIEYPVLKSSIKCTTPRTRIVSLPTQSKPT